MDGLGDLLFKLPGGTGTEITREMEGVQRIREAPAQGGKPPEQMSPQELHSVLWQVLEATETQVRGTLLLYPVISDSSSEM